MIQHAAHVGELELTKHSSLEVYLGENIRFVLSEHSADLGILKRQSIFKLLSICKMYEHTASSGI